MKVLTKKTSRKDVYNINSLAVGSVKKNETGEARPKIETRD